MYVTEKGSGRVAVRRGDGGEKDGSTKVFERKDEET